MIAVAGHQANLYPYGGFFAKAVSVETFVIVDNSQYVRKQYQNRNRIKLNDGSVKWLSIPVKKSGRFEQQINEVEIDDHQDWRRKHRRTLELNYGKAPFFDQYYPPFAELLDREWRLLVDYNLAVIKCCFELLEFPPNWIIASQQGIEGVATGLILDICRKTGSDSYLHGKHSRDYVDFQMLANSGIKNYIQDFKSLEYPQVSGEFIENLSILDLLFNCGNGTGNLLRDSSKIFEA